jgi:hypothetical protein
MDNLENFINENRSSFDDKVPNLEVWAKINDQLDQNSKPKVRHLRMYTYATRIAAACLLLFVGAFGSYKYFQVDNLDVVSIGIDKIAPEYAEEVAVYQQEVSLKMNKLANYKSAYKVSEDMLQLDEAFDELLKELESVPYSRRTKILNALISNFENKINVLDKVIEEVESTDSESINKIQDEISL